MSKFIRPFFVLLLSALVFLAWYAQADEHDGLLEVFPPEGFVALVFIEDSGSMTSFTNEMSDVFYILPDPNTCRVDVYILQMVGEAYRHFHRFDLCDAPAHEPVVETGVECLGIAWSGSGTFTVDGYEYSYDGHLSFIVPFDAIWRWELFIDEHLVFVFEQTEPGNCHIVYSS